MTSPTTQLYRSLVEERATSLQEDYYRCVGGVVRSLLIIRGMMLLSGTWEEEYEKSLDEIPTLEAVKRLTVDGTDLWSMMTSKKQEIK
jgi:hypothetical protein